ncbi:hypothetical protein [Actinokineospora sp. NBRC 105648]|uniref:hypothetical protein n=1 Tax=Actinokineospora sp. NBRC 105648 TaxID=3032206 RepID=UPI0025557720|nr:hypothetical protein [Actinokineospora sp. NBRC 105648]
MVAEPVAVVAGVVEPAVRPVAGLVSVADPLVGAVTGLVGHSVLEPVLSTVVQPVVSSVVEPVVGAVVQPVVDAVVEPVLGDVVEPVLGAAIMPVVGTVVVPVVGSVAEPVVGSSAPAGRVLVPPVVSAEAGAAVQHPVSPPRAVPVERVSTAAAWVSTTRWSTSDARWSVPAPGAGFTSPPGSPLPGGAPGAPFAVSGGMSSAAGSGSNGPVNAVTAMSSVVPRPHQSLRAPPGPRAEGAWFDPYGLNHPS